MEFAQAVAGVLRALHEKAWLVGQSLGGFVAQIIAKNYPDVVEGLVLSNTGSLLADMSEDAFHSLMDMIKSSEKSRKLLRLVPFSLYKRMVKYAVMKKKTADFGPEDFAYCEGKVLLILSKDDSTFHEEVKQSLIDIMPHPAVITGLTGGHLALMVRPDDYERAVTGFILQET